MIAKNAVNRTLSFAATVGAAALYNGGDSTWWLYAFEISLILWTFTIRLEGRSCIPRVLLSLIMAAELGWLVTLSFLSPIPDLSWAQILVLGSAPLAYFFGCAASKDSHQVSMAEQVLSLFATAILGLAVLELIVLHARPFSTFLDSNVLAAYANVFFFATYPRIVGDWQTNGAKAALRSRKAALAFLALVASFATTSLGGFLCFSGGMALVTMIGARRTPAFLAAAVPVIMIATVTYISVYAIQDRPTPLSRIAAEASTGGHASDEQGTFVRERGAMYASALQMIHDQPWYGAGPGLFIVLYPKYRSPSDQSSLGSLAHNDYLQFLLEGGPILLGCLLALLAYIVVSLSRTAKVLWRDNEVPPPAILRRLGLQIALLTMFMHAIPNFIFYSLSLSLIAGLMLSQLPEAETNTLDLSRIITPLSKVSIAGFVVIVLTTTIGLRAVVVELENHNCFLRGCDEYQADPSKLMPLVSTLLAIQPSWVHGTDFLVAEHMDLAIKSTTSVEKWTHVLQAVTISSTTLRRYPAIYTQYSVLAGVLESYPAAATSVVDGVPRMPKALYEEALSWNPQYTRARVRLATLQARDDGDDIAWNTIFAGTQWWKLYIISDADRHALLSTALPLAVRTRHCMDAAEMAEGLLLLEPSQPLAIQIVKRGTDGSELDPTRDNCGLDEAPALPL